MKRRMDVFVKTALITLLSACALSFGMPAERRASAAEPLSFNGVFGDDMILQREKRVKIWGYGGTRGAFVCVSFAGQEKTAVIGEGGWEVFLDPMPASAEGKTLTVAAGRETIAVHNVCVGEVLMCSGQSNVAISVQYIFNKSDAAIDDYKTYDNFGLIRLYTPVWGGKTEETIYTAPYSVWRKPKRIQDVLNCSAYAVSLALHVQAKLGNQIPVGVIEASTGGSCIEEWLSEDNAKALPSHSGSHSSYYNGMVAFLRGLTLNGVFWYQGEACVEYTGHYEKQLAALIEQYRTDFEDETLPVYIMQLPQLNAAVAYGNARFESSWVKMREVQDRVSQEKENVYTVCLIDTGDASEDHDCIHPADKWQVGERAAGAFVAATLKLSYEKLAAEGSYGLSPKIRSAVWKDGFLTLDIEGGERFACKDAAVGGFEIVYEDGSKENLSFRLQGKNLIASATKKAVKIGYLQTDKVSGAFVVNEYNLPVMPVYEMAVEDQSSSYTVRFIDGESLLKEQTVVYGEQAESYTPEKEDLTFDGWYADAALSDRFDFSRGIFSDTTLYAKFMPPVDSPSDGSEKNSDKGCKSSMAAIGVLPFLGAAAILKKKDEKRK